jgi:glycogen synthase
MMKIAFISYEYPPDTAYGGISTYVYQASKMMHERGHHVEVFSSSPHQGGTESNNGILVHRIKEENRYLFPKLVSELFLKQHKKVRFDVIEGPEFYAEAREIVRAVPDIPLVVKLHTPSFILDRLNSIESSYVTKITRYLGSIRRGVIPINYWSYNPRKDIECSHTLDADEIVILTHDMGNQVINLWGLDAKKVVCIPNPYIPSAKLLDIPANTNTNIITFIGRLETRKGVVDLARAIPLVLQRNPNAKFRFVGRSEISPQSKLDMRQYLESMLDKYKESIEFTGSVSPDEIPSILLNTDICIFPSIWENFPNVCLEAMAAARGVIGSSAGGMAEMLNHGEVGRIIPPRNPEKIAEAINELLENPALRVELGKNARNRLLAEYSIERVATMQEASYERAIKRRQAEGSRYQNVR